MLRELPAHMGYLLTAEANLAPKFNVERRDHPAFPSHIPMSAHCREETDAVREKFKFSIPS